MAVELAPRNEGAALPGGCQRLRLHRDVFEAPRELLRYVIPKGSIAIDGISLTVNEVDDYTFAVALIPHTVEATTLAVKNAGSKVNLEVDMIGKYVEKLVTGYAPGARR